MANNSAQLFKDLLTLRRRAMGRANRNKTIKASQNTKLAWIFPFALQRRYFNYLKNIQREIVEIGHATVKENLEQWIKDYKQSQGKSDSRQDAYLQDFRELLSVIEQKSKEIFETNETQTRFFINTIALDLSVHNQKQWQKFIKKVFGAEFVSEELWEREAIDVWSDNNYRLVKSLSNEYIKELNFLVSEAVERGATAASIQDTVKDYLIKSKKLADRFINKRTELIARDQVGKLNGIFTERRQKDAGIDMYIWSTSGDERVRGNPGGRYPNAIPSHFDIDGKICRWDDTGVYSIDDGVTWLRRSGKMPLAHPGMEIRCRCTAIPYFVDLLREIDKIIEQETA